MKTESPKPDPDELVALLDQLIASGSQHINLQLGEETRVQTVNSTDCSGKPGACAVPNFNLIDAEIEKSDDDESDDYE
ncbi:MAG TPA: hypothetical protein DCG49_09840 [Ruminococcus sp.]|nr:hypothetical protein [Ruminococcus sp.]